MGMAGQLYGSRRHGAGVGLLAVFAGLCAGELVVGLVRGSSSPVVPVGQEVIDVVPAAVKDWAIDWFGTADKAVLIAGTVLILAMVGALAGVLAITGRRAAAYAVAAGVGAIGVAAALARPGADIGRVLPPIAGTAVSIVVLWRLTPHPSGDADDVDSVATVDPNRRRLARDALLVGALSLVAAGFGRLLARRFSVEGERASGELPEPDRAVGDDVSSWDFGLAGTTPFVVANDHFYRIDTALVVPQVPKDSWSLRIHGMVDRELTLTFAELAERELVERYITLACVSNPVGGDLVGNAKWLGTPLADLLREVGPHREATQVVSRSIDGWTCGTPTSAIMDGRDALLAIAMNDEPLPAEHGYPVRMVVPGLFGYVSATKWVTEIELVRWEDFDAYWVPRGWAKEGPVKTMARIDRPTRGSEHPAGTVDVAGVAWAVHRGISVVEVSIDEGEWRECELAGVPTDDTWRQWRYVWSDAAAGEHTIDVRAYDGEGVPQPARRSSPAPDGAQGYHRTRFQVG